MKDVTVVYWHDFIAAYFDGCFLHDDPAKNLIDCRVGIFAGQLNGEDETCSPWDDDIINTQVWESHK